MNTRTKFLITSVITGALGALYTFSSYNLIKKTLRLGFGLRHNDHVMIGTIGLTIAAAALYAYFMRKDK